MSPTGNGSAVSKPVREEENVRLTRAVEEYLAALEAGRKPDRRDVPDAANSLTE